MRLKRGQIYIHKETGNIGILRRSSGVFSQSKTEKFWELEFISSVYPEELNSQFLEDVKQNYFCIGEL